MKILEPTISVLLTSHMKPTLRGALESICCQTRKRDVQVVVIDSGAWFDREDDVAKAMESIYHDFQWNKNIEWYFTGEPHNAVDIYCPVAHWFNVAYRLDLLKGKYICTFYDDDIYYSRFMESMGGYLDAHPDAMAVWCSEDRYHLHADGSTRNTGVIAASRDINHGENMDCMVDGMQVMLRREALDAMIAKFGTDELIPEDPNRSVCSHSDGIFYNKLIQTIDKVHHINEVHCRHQHTIYSTYSPIAG